MQTDQLEHFREKLRMAQDETKNMQAKNELLERLVGWLKTNHSCEEMQLCQNVRVLLANAIQSLLC